MGNEIRWRDGRQRRKGGRIGCCRLRVGPSIDARWTLRTRSHSRLILPPSVVVPSVALSGSDLLSGCVAERVVEFEGTAGAWAIGATIPFSPSSSSSESERAVTKLPCALNRHLRRLLRRVVGLSNVILEGAQGGYRVVRCSKVEGSEDEWALRLCEGNSLRLQKSNASMDVVRRQNTSSLCGRGKDVYHTLHEHCLGLPIDIGVVGSMSIRCSCFGVGTEMA